MSHKEPSNSIYEDVDSSEQTIRLVKDVPIDANSKETKEVDVLADFKSESDNHEEKKTSKNIKVVEVGYEDDIPFEPTRELKIKRDNSYNNNNDEYKEKVLVNHSADSVGVKKIIVGEETTTLPVYKKPKKDLQTTIRDIFIYLMMVAIVSILVILLLKYCNKEDKETLLDIPTSTKTTTTITSLTPSTETTTTSTTMPINTETTTKSTTKKPNLVIPTNATTKKQKTTTKSTAGTTEPTKPTESTKPVETTEPTNPTGPTEPEEPTIPETPDNSNEQG